MSRRNASWLVPALLLALPQVAQAQMVRPQMVANPAILSHFNADTPPQLNVAISVNGPGNVRWGGSICSAPAGQNSALCQRTVAKDTPVTFIPTPYDGQVFKGWNGACAGQAYRCMVKPSANFAISASFGPPDQKPMVSIKVNIPTAGGKVMPSTFSQGNINCTHDLAGYYGGTCTTQVPMGTQVSLTATPQSPAQFTGWSSDQGACSGSGTCDFTAKDPVVINANFVNPNKTMTLTVIYSRGYVSLYQLITNPNLDFTCNPPGYPAGNTGQSWTVTCTAGAPAGSVIKLKANMIAGIGSAATLPVKNGGWGGECGGTTGDTCLLGMDKNRTVIVNASQN